MMGFGHFSSSSSSSSSNLSPLAPPFTVERSNNSKLNSNSILDSHFNGKSDGIDFMSIWPNFQYSSTTQGLLADSMRTATVPSSNFTIPNPNSSPSTHNWSFMNSSIKSGLEPVIPPPVSMSATNPNPQPFTWSFGSDDSDADAPMLPLNFDLLSSRSLVHGYESSQVNYSQSLSGSKYSGQIGGSREKEDSAMFGGVYGDRVIKENNIPPSIIGKSHGASSSSSSSSSSSIAHHGLVSSGFPKEHTFTWNEHTSYYPFETRSILYDSSNGHVFPSITKSSPSLVIKPPVSASLFNKNNGSVTHKLLKETDSSHTLGFEFKASSSSQAPDINNTDDLKSATNMSENLDLLNPGEDSPCWKGAPARFSSRGSQEPESSHYPMKNRSFDGTMDQSTNITIENGDNRETFESLDVNVVVKALSNLSELLLINYSKDESGLKEHDHKALDHVVANLNACMSRKIERVDPVQKDTFLNVLQEETKNDHFGKNNEELQSASLRDDDLHKDHNMIQKIKKVLDENLESEEDLPSHTLLYKNLWLEAEAELCALSYKTRFHRAKREIGKLKASASDVSEVASDIKKISSPDISPIAPKLMHDNFENSVMARFSVLKNRGDSNSVNTEENERANVKVSVNAVVMHPHGNQKTHAMHVEDDERLVMLRLNVLKSRDEGVRQATMGSGGGPSPIPNRLESGLHMSSYNASSDWEHVLKDEFS